MKVHIFLFIFSAVSIHIFQYFKFISKLENYLIIIKKIKRTVFSKKISDHWKEKIIFKYSYLLFFSSARILCFFAIILVFYLILNYIYPLFGSYLLTVKGTLEATIIGLIYFYLKNMNRAQL